jgi:hypothetical protein
VQRCYERFDPGTAPGLRLPRPEDVQPDPEELAPRFEAPVFRWYRWEQEFATEQYLDLLLTYSGHRAMEPGAQRALLHCIANLIDTRYGGHIVKTYLNELRVATRAGTGS